MFVQGFSSRIMKLRRLFLWNIWLLKLIKMHLFWCIWVSQPQEVNSKIGPISLIWSFIIIGLCRDDEHGTDLQQQQQRGELQAPEITANFTFQHHDHVSDEPAENHHNPEPDRLFVFTLSGGMFLLFSLFCLQQRIRVGVLMENWRKKLKKKGLNVLFNGMKEETNSLFDKKLYFSRECGFISGWSPLRRVHPLLRALRAKQPFPSLRSLSYQLCVSLPARLSAALRFGLPQSGRRTRESLQRLDYEPARRRLKIGCDYNSSTPWCTSRR